VLLQASTLPSDDLLAALLGKPRSRWLGSSISGCNTFYILSKQKKMKK
jgi:hypothetical protein